MLQIHHHKYWDQLEASVEGSSYEGLGEFVDWNNPADGSDWNEPTGPIIGIIDKPAPIGVKPIIPGVPALPSLPIDDLAILQDPDNPESTPAKPVASPVIPPFNFFPTTTTTRTTTTTKRPTTTQRTTMLIPTYATEPAPHPEKITSDVPAVKTGIAVALPTFMLLFALGVLFSLFSSKKSNQVTPPGKRSSGLCGVNSVTDPNNPNYGKWDHEMAPDQLKPELFSPTQIREYYF